MIFMNWKVWIKKRKFQKKDALFDKEILLNLEEYLLWSRSLVSTKLGGRHIKRKSWIKIKMKFLMLIRSTLILIQTTLVLIMNLVKTGDLVGMACKVNQMLKLNLPDLDNPDQSEIYNLVILWVIWEMYFTCSNLKFQLREVILLNQVLI